jgi:hydroxymethylglutaryl-CoA lyase
MSSMPAPAVLISEVGPRDGLQSVKAVMPTAAKLRWVDALHAAGLREIEVASFVPAKLLPQMADAAEVVRHASALPGLCVMALVPNLQGAQAALAAGVHKLTIPVSASPAHSMANVRRTPQDMVEQVRAIVALRHDTAPGVGVEVGISTAFGCTLQGAVADDDVIRLAVALAQAGVDEVGLSDTTGMANPAQVRRLFTRLRAELGGKAGAAHMHNTRGLGLANCLAAYDVGVRTFDSFAGWPGRLPVRARCFGQCGDRRPGLHVRSHGRDHRRDLEKLIAARAPLMAGLPGEPVYGMTPEAGLPKGFAQEFAHV